MAVGDGVGVGVGVGLGVTTGVTRRVVDGVPDVPEQPANANASARNPARRRGVAPNESLLDMTAARQMLFEPDDLVHGQSFAYRPLDPGSSTTTTAQSHWKSQHHDPRIVPTQRAS